MIRKEFSRIVALFVAAAVFSSSNTALADSLSVDDPTVANSTEASDTGGTKDAASSDSSQSTSSSEEYENDMLTNNYTNVSKNYSAPAYQGERVVIKAAESYDGQGGGTITTD